MISETFQGYKQNEYCKEGGIETLGYVFASARSLVFRKGEIWGVTFEARISLNFAERLLFKFRYGLFLKGVWEREKRELPLEL